jgi:hypothetical protein
MRAGFKRPVGAWHDALDVPKSCREDFAQLRRREIEPAVTELKAKGEQSRDLNPDLRRGTMEGPTTHETAALRERYIHLHLLTYIAFTLGGLTDFPRRVAQAARCRCLGRPAQNLRPPPHLTATTCAHLS